MFLSVKFWALTYSQGEGGELLGLRSKALPDEPSLSGSPGGSCPFGAPQEEFWPSLVGEPPRYRQFLQLCSLHLPYCQPGKGEVLGDCLEGPGD